MHSKQRQRGSELHLSERGGFARPNSNWRGHCRSTAFSGQCLFCLPFSQLFLLFSSPSAWSGFIVLREELLPWTISNTPAFSATKHRRRRPRLPLFRWMPCLSCSPSRYLPPPSPTHSTAILRLICAAIGHKSKRRTNWVAGQRTQENALSSMEWCLGMLLFPVNSKAGR